MILKHRDRELLRFDWVEPQGVRIVSVNEAERQFLPLEMRGALGARASSPRSETVVTDESLWTWLRRRTVPKNRHYVDAMLGHLGIRQKDTRAIIELCRGLSLNDVYWVVPDDFSGLWRDFNLYQNAFSKTLAVLAFTGMATSAFGKGEDFSTSPEFTTNGMLAKCWRRKDGTTYLYKSGTEGAANLGFEPYSEFYAAQIAAVMGLPHVEYGLEKFKGRLCSTCPLFTGERYGFLPAGALLSKDEAIADPRFRDIFLFDAIVLNTDRHLGNLGFLIDNETNEIVGSAPIFDNGNSLFSLALYRPNSRYDDFADLRKFIARVSPALYDDWLSFPGGVTDEMKQRLTHLKGFRFSRHKYYNLPAARLKVIEDFIQRRIAEIVDTPCRPCRSADGPSAASKAVEEGGGVTSPAAPCRSADGPSATSKAVEEGGGIPLPARIVAGQCEADGPSALRQTKEPLWHSRGYLPHVENKVLQFITYRLFDSVPSEVVDQWRTALGISESADPNAPECQELRRRIEQYADAGHGSCLLADERVAAMVQENLLHFDGERYRLVDWCIMPNHVHVLIEVADNWTVSKIVQGWRSYTAHEANKILGRTGRFWQPEYFDRYIRNEKHLSDTIAYIDTNPDKAGLKEWKWRALYRSTAAPYTPTAASCQTTTPAAPCRSADGPSAASKAVDEGGGIPLPARTGNGQCEADEPSALRQTTPTLPSPARIVAGQREVDGPSALRQEGRPQP